MRHENLIETVEAQLNAIANDILKLDETLSLHSKGKCSDYSVFKLFHVLSRKYPANSLIIGRLLEFLQLVNDDKILKHYRLEEIELSYVKLSQVYKDDAEIHTEYYHYLHSVCDKEKQALRVFNKFKKRINKKLSL